MDQLDAMRAFLAVADRSSFTQAARTLRWSPATTTRAVAQLESTLGQPLLTRTTRTVRLTERGQLYAEKCRAILNDVEAAANLVRGTGVTPSGTLAITAPVTFGRLHVMPIALQLMTRHPALKLRLTVLDRVTNLVEEGFDAAFRIGPLADSALLATKLAEVRRILVASPAYLARNGTPTHPNDLKHHQIVSFEGIGSTNEWRFGTTARTTIRVTPTLAVNDAAAAIQALENGHGIGRLLSYQAQQALAAGTLTPLLTPHEPTPLPITLLYQPTRKSSPNLQALLAAARHYLAATPLHPPHPASPT